MQRSQHIVRISGGQRIVIARINAVSIAKDNNFVTQTTPQSIDFTDTKTNARTRSRKFDTN
ncbi:MAG: hypothetical protein E6Q62_03265 [Nitrosomonas sp.]|nr:MAG: hypothetical protein E6Q62_03265 [Nitrosomonas sp.]